MAAVPHYCALMALHSQVHVITSCFGRELHMPLHPLLLSCLVAHLMGPSNSVLSVSQRSSIVHATRQKDPEELSRTEGVKDIQQLRFVSFLYLLQNFGLLSIELLQLLISVFRSPWSEVQKSEDSIYPNQACMLIYSQSTIMQSQWWRGAVHILSTVVWINLPMIYCCCYLIVWSRWTSCR